jgi:hypothetical protein
MKREGGLSAQTVCLVGIDFQEPLPHLFRHSVCRAMKVNASTAFIPPYGSNQNDQGNHIDSEQASIQEQPIQWKYYPNQQHSRHDGLFDKVVRSWLWFKISRHPPDKHALEGIFALHVMWTMGTKELEYDNGKNQDRRCHIDDHPNR